MMMTRNVDSKIREEAKLWFARRRDPSVCDQEREAFERWRTSDPRHAEAYAQAERLWERLAVLKQSEKLAAVVSVPLKTDGAGVAVSGLPRPSRFDSDLQAQDPDAGTVAGNAGSTPTPAPRRRAFYAIAASIALFTIGVTSYLLYNRAPVQTFATALGEQRTEALADGTTLRLNTSSTLDVRMTSGRREVTLENGEAAFDVAKDVTRPFVVTAGDGTVTALGTHFQVRHEANQVTVTLMEGRVQLTRASRREFEWLEPGQQATFSEDASGIVRRNVDVKAATSWMSGRLEFQSMSLQEAVAEANRYSERKIRISDPSINEIEVGGTFRTGDNDGIATAFEAAFPIRADIGEKEIVLYGK